jgi:hypothetical protein
MNESKHTFDLINLLMIIVPFLSGGFAGAVFTYLIKKRTEKKNRKILSVQITDIPLSIPDLSNDNNLPIDKLKLSLDGNTYDNIRAYNMIVKNVGFQSIEGLKLVFKSRDKVSLIKDLILTEPLSIECNQNILNDNDGTEIYYSIGRLEREDKVKIALLLNSTPQNELKCITRGVDDIDILTATNELLINRTIELSRNYKIIVISTVILMILILISMTLLFLFTEPSDKKTYFIGQFNGIIKLIGGFLIGIAISKYI